MGQYYKKHLYSCKTTGNPDLNRLSFNTFKLDVRNVYNSSTRYVDQKNAQTPTLERLKKN